MAGGPSREPVLGEVAGEVERGAQGLYRGGLAHDGDEAETAAAGAGEWVYPEHATEEVLP